RARLTQAFLRNGQPSKPAIGFLLLELPPTILPAAPARPVPYLDIDKSEQAAGGGIDGNRRMNQNPPRRPATAHRPKAGSPQLPAARHDLGRILDHHNIAARSPLPGARSHARSHLRHAHPRIAQKSVELNLAAPLASQSPDARARLFHQGSMQQSPPFSRRRSPNRPSSNPVSTRPSLTNHLHQGVSLHNPGQPRCVHVIAAFAGMTGEEIPNRPTPGN